MGRNRFQSARLSSPWKNSPWGPKSWIWDTTHAKNCFHFPRVLKLTVQDFDDHAYKLSKLTGPATNNHLHTMKHPDNSTSPSDSHHVIQPISESNVVQLGVITPLDHEINILNRAVTSTVFKETGTPAWTANNKVSMKLTVKKHLWLG